LLWKKIHFAWLASVSPYFLLKAWFGRLLQPQEKIPAIQRFGHVFFLIQPFCPLLILAPAKGEYLEFFLIFFTLLLYFFHSQTIAPAKLKTVPRKVPVLLLSSCALLLLSLPFVGNEPVFEAGVKIHGISFTGPPRPVEPMAFQPIGELGSNWVCLMPYAFMQPAESPVLHFESSRQWWGERKEGIVACVEMARAQGLQVMVKPHIWMRGGVFTGDYAAASTGDWEIFEEGYRQYILFHAALADSLQVPLFCLGTELATFVRERPAFWHQLIGEVRNVYRGKLTYAENWNAWEAVPFWPALDYIGIDAYFPLSEKPAPTVGELVAAWQPHYRALRKMAHQVKKPVLFTEYGYRSTDFATREPWDFQVAHPVNLQVQADAYEAMFQKFFHEKWFAGGFLWKWYSNTDRMADRMLTDYTPQGKPALVVLKTWFAR
jgi:hypothetical protein